MLQNFFVPLDREDNWPTTKPLLAHYTSIENLEAIVRSNELWFSNPLTMNDYEEIRFGFEHGLSIFRDNIGIADAFSTKCRHDEFLRRFSDHFHRYDRQALLDTYVFCLSLHDETDLDGRLSMWRGYGGNGHGAAIVFDTSQLSVAENTPLIVSKIEYGSLDQRRNYLIDLANLFAQCVKNEELRDEQIDEAAYWCLERIKLFALFNKHAGFSEEQEWRVVYMRERDQQDKLVKKLSYARGRGGYQPKLKLPIEPIDGLSDESLDLSKLIYRIILGPTHSSPLAVRAVQRMLQELDRSDLVPRVIPSTIPYRTT